MWGHAYRDWAFRLKKIGDLSFFFPQEKGDLIFGCGTKSLE
jgi:hypothetical protein